MGGRAIAPLADFDVPRAVHLGATDEDAFVRYVASFLASVQPGAFVVDYEGALEVADAIGEAHLVGEAGRIVRALLPNEERLDVRSAEGRRAVEDLVAAATSIEVQTWRS